MIEPFFFLLVAVWSFSADPIKFFCMQKYGSHDCVSSTPNHFKVIFWKIESSNLLPFKGFRPNQSKLITCQISDPMAVSRHPLTISKSVNEAVTIHRFSAEPGKLNYMQIFDLIALPRHPRTISK